MEVPIGRRRITRPARFSRVTGKDRAAAFFLTIAWIMIATAILAESAKHYFQRMRIRQTMVISGFDRRGWRKPASLGQFHPI